MSKQSKIYNLAELRAEIARLKVLSKEQEGYLKSQFTLLNHKIETPVRVFSALKNSVPGLSVLTDLLKSNNANKNSDWLTKTLRIGVPFVLNKVIFKKAGMVQKALMLLASEKALGQVNQDKMSGLIAKVTSFIKPKKKKKKVDPIIDPTTEERANEYGIPPYSETY